MPVDRMPMYFPIETRDGTLNKDSRTTNALFEQGGSHKDFLKRPGLVYSTSVLSSETASTFSQGLVSFNGKLLSVINNTVYSTVPSGATTTVGSMTSNLSYAYFAKTFLDTKVFMHNKASGHVLSNTGTFTTLANDTVQTITITNPGQDYSEGITLGFSGLSPVVATATVTNGAITAVNIVSSVSGLTTAPTCIISVPSPKTLSATSSGRTLTVSSTTGVYVGMFATGTGLPTGTKVAQIVSTTAILLDRDPTAPLSGVSVTFTDQGKNGALTPELGQFPSGPYVSGAVYLDNFVFVGTASDNRIYSSHYGDPTAWSALSYVSFNQTTDTLIGIAKHLNYLVAFGKSSIQFFYDAGTGTSTVSPLGVAQSYTLELGCASGDSIVSSDNTVVWISTSRASGKAVHMLNGVSPNKVSTPAIDKVLEADGLSQVTSYMYRYYGHTLYILTLHTSGKTLVYDLGEGTWTEWTQYALQPSLPGGPTIYAESYFRGCFYAEANGTPYVLDAKTSKLYFFDNDTYQDAGQPIYCRVVTSIVDGGSTHRKFYGRLEVVGDKVSGGVMQIRHTGDDYNTWSSYRTVNLGASRPQIYLGGSDRRRAWEFLSTSNVPLRLEAAELDYRSGEMDQEQMVGRKR